MSTPRMPTLSTTVQVVSFFRRPLFRASHASNPTMTDRERLLEAEVAWLQYGSERMNLVLRERFFTDDTGKHYIAEARKRE